MTAVLTHPTPQELTAFGLGKLPDEGAVAAVARHLETCRACRDSQSDLAVVTQPEERWFAVEQRGDVTMVQFAARNILDEDEAQAIGERLYALVEREGYRQLVLNFAGVRVMTSTMLAKLVALRYKVHAVGARLALCGTSPELGEVFDALQLPQLFEIYSDEEDALQGP